MDRQFLDRSQFSLSLLVLQLGAEEANPRAGIPRQSNPCTLGHHNSHIFGIWTVSLVFHHLCWQIPELGMWGLLCPHPTGTVGGVRAHGRERMGWALRSLPTQLHDSISTIPRAQFHNPMILLAALSPCPKVRGTHPDCSVVLQFQEREAECLERIRSESLTPALPGQEGCPTDWDGVSCWPALPLGQSRAVACPDILNVFKKSKGLIQRNCTEWGWSLPSPPYHSSCQLETLSSNNDTEAKARHFVTMKVLYTCGYSTSLAALLLAIGIFSCFRKLHCTRNSIHIHFFTSFILRGTAVFIKDSVLFSDESINHCTMSTVITERSSLKGHHRSPQEDEEGDNPLWPQHKVTCKAAIAFFQYSVLANFYWLLVEGLYLQTLLLLTFTCDRSYTWGYILMGWGVPMVTVGVWVLTRLHYDDHGRLTKSTLLLIPLFGVHYVVFALFPEHVGVDARLYFELVLGSYQGFLVALLYCFLNGEVQAEIRRNWGKWQRSMESNVFNLATQDFTA
ncbi:vasoactive intestinal polypeptide receptor 1-like isoform 5-T5 [Acridotheres tristis]